MALTARTGILRGTPFFIEKKPTGEVKATVNKENRDFATWNAAVKWVEYEIKRDSRG